MLRATGRTIGTLTIAAVILTTLLGLIVPAVAAVHAPSLKAPAAPSVAGPVANHMSPAVVSSHPASTRPLAGPSGPVGGTATITSSYTGKQDVPVMVTWTITVKNATITAKNVSLSLLVTNGANTIANLSQPVTAGQVNYSANVDYAALSQLNYNGGTLPVTPYAFTVWMQVQNTSNKTLPWLNVSSAPVSATLAITNAGALITNSIPLYDALPFWLNFTTSYGGNTGAPVNHFNATITVELRFIESGCNSIFGLGAPCQSIANNSVTFNSTNAYSLSIDSSYFTSSNFVNGQLPIGEYQVIVWNTYSNFTDPSSQPRTVAAAAYVYPVLDPNSVSWLSPSPTAPSSTGNITIAAKYTADFLSAANVTVYQGATGTGTVVFSAGVFDAGLAVHAASAIWENPIAGEYTVVLAIVTAAGAAAGTPTFSLTFNVSAGAAGGGIVYYNQTIWQNTTTNSGSLFGGLSPGVSAAILLVVGLIVGMIVAMLLGRMMWGGAKSAPAQPWQAKPGTNECSICHQSFATEGELKDHQKQAHGM
ncbi:MAG TPA: hypothetical protein VEY07_04180 [Thermoplasmata archaeon]|nr:hypothetical protein [Thermoplasmata archaeon]